MQACSRSIRGTDHDRGRSLRDICLVGTELIDLACHIAVASVSGEKMSKHSVSAGDISALLARFSELRRKCARGPENPSQSSSFGKRGWTASGFTVPC